MGVHTVDRDSVEAALQKETDDVVHVQPRCHTDGSNAIERLLRRIESVQGNLGTPKKDPDDIQAAGSHQGFVWDIHVIPADDWFISANSGLEI